MTVNMGTATFADENEPELVDINGHLCYERDGLYWTIMNGIEYLVIDIGDGSGGEIEQSDMNAAMPASATGSIGTPANWTNSTEVSFPNNSPAYSCRADLTNGDWCSPIFLVTPCDGEYTLKINNGGLVAYNGYYANLYYHLQSDNGWHAQTNILIAFSLLMQYHLLITGSATSITDGVAIKFLKSKSTGEPVFNFSLEPCMTS